MLTLYNCPQYGPPDGRINDTNDRYLEGLHNVKA
jgi:hypothetical protein